LKPLGLKLHPTDNVAVVLEPVAAGTAVLVDGRPIVAGEAVPAFHKIALEDMGFGELALKYGAPIGETSQSVRRGSWVHSHNLRTGLSEVMSYLYEPDAAAEHESSKGLTFDGYRRSNGAVGTRNEIWILPTVVCVNNTAESIARACTEHFVRGIDGVFAFGHPYGCSQSGDDLENTRRILAGLMQNPNAGGVLLLGLGCENNQIESQLQAANEIDPSRFKYFNSQDVEDEFEHGVSAVRELAQVIEHDTRTECPVSELVVGLECGGSDALSGITANPLIGQVADRIVAEGGGAILSEVPEMFGAEQTIMNRATDEVVFADIVQLINNHKRHFTDLGLPIYENPSPGNLEGGLTTLEEKSLGAIRKGGVSPIAEVLRYGSRKKVPGLSLLDTPGNDAVSSTALVAAGATAIMFTTGRGTPLGSPVPTIKISTNTPVMERKPAWIDFNAGTIADGTSAVDHLEADLLDLLLHVASGRIQTRNEVVDNRGIAIWKTGVTH